MTVDDVEMKEEIKKDGDKETKVEKTQDEINKISYEGIYNTFELQIYFSSFENGV